VDHPFLINDFVRPACLPPVGWTEKLNGGKMVISGMGKTLNSRKQSRKMQVATIPMKSKFECKNNPNLRSAFRG